MSQYYASDNTSIILEPLGGWQISFHKNYGHTSCICIQVYLRIITSLSFRSHQNGSILAYSQSHILFFTYLSPTPKQTTSQHPKNPVKTSQATCFHRTLAADKRCGRRSGGAPAVRRSSPTPEPRSWSSPKSRWTPPDATVGCRWFWVTFFGAWFFFCANLGGVWK